MDKITYSDLVKNFKSISLPIDTIVNFCCDDEIMGISNIIQSQNRNLERLMYLQDNLSINDISSIIIKKDGLYYNLKKVLFKITSIYNINECNVTTIENKIRELKKIKTEEDIKNISMELYKKYKYLLKNTNLSIYKHRIKIQNRKNNQKRTLEEQKLKKEYKSKINKTTLEEEEYKKKLKKIYETYPIMNEDKVIYELIIEKFRRKNIDLLNTLLKYSKNNFNNLARVSDYILQFIDFEKLGLVLAVTVKDLAQDNRNNTQLYKNVLIYLKEYIEENKKLVLENYTLEKSYNNVLGISGIKKYEISSIVDFIHTSMDDEKQEKRNLYKNMKIEKYDYSFFEYSSVEKSKEILETYKKIGNNKYNDEFSKKVLDSKINFYEKIGYDKIAVGINSFDGYIGFCLDNGIVILDKFFENIVTSKIAMDEAAYITTVEEFDKVTKLTKSDCIEKIKKKEINAIRIIHSEGWQERVNQKVEELIKK